ncbi:uroporphyrinogen decarboxylase/cobalamine-independent methonine synthase family protein [Nocardioides bizhenqiangii]|uniref:Methionine synthase n=1 Tax=Nocardioides bizhenqiangii TaxID=3095076 RepID=A0ABZ0ZU96_9ACTN|nr:methionine synthase [Nocardioides sp. HM61]WQQ27911.1 methionine synthase [Nocardioides sp. HM61]
MTLATGVGSFPGTDQRDFDEALRVVLGELGLPFLPEVPGRGAGAAMIGRTIGLVTELDADLQPAGWRLTGTSGAPALDQRRASSLLGQDLDTLEEHAADHPGPFKVQVAGPWTLAATVERPRGDRVLADHGARRELAQALAMGVADHVADVRRRLSRTTRIVVQVDEPALPAVLAGAVPTASGFGRHRTVHPPEASETLGWVLGAVRGAGAEPWVHCCAPDAPLALVRDAGAAGLAVDLSLVGADGQDALAAALEAGDAVALGVVPSTDPAVPPTEKEVVAAVHRWLDLLGLDPAQVTEGLVLSPTCGQAGASSAWVKRSLAILSSAAASLS